MKNHQDFPEHCITRLDLRVRFCETDLMGIVHHSNYVGYLEAGRLAYLRHREFNYRLMTERGYHMPVVDMHLRYRKGARFDDELIIETRPDSLTRVTVNFAYRILRPGLDHKLDLIAEGSTLLACVGEDHRPRAIPSDVREILFAPESDVFARSHV